MIEVTRINGTTFMINPDLIETVEETPDTVITLVNGHKYVVKESNEELRRAVIEFKNLIFCGFRQGTEQTGDN